MKSYLDPIAQMLAERCVQAPDSCLVIVPSAQVAKALQAGMASHIGKAFWSPRMVTLAQFCEFASGRRISSQPDLLTILYDSYVQQMSDSQPFAEFKGWGESLLRDFQDIQLSQVDEESLFADLREMKDIDEWSYRLGELTAGQEEFLDIWKKMGDVYRTFIEMQQNSGMLSYSTLVSMLIGDTTWTGSLNSMHVIVAGHRVLTNAERKLIEIIPSKELWLDRDQLYQTTLFHEAGAFIKRSGRNFSYVDPPGNNWHEYSRQIRLHPCTTAVSECVLAGQLLSTIAPHEWRNTAIVLTDDKWIPVLLDHIPEQVPVPVVAHGYSLMHADIASLVISLAELAVHQAKGRRANYRDLLNVLSHDALSGLCAGQLETIEEYLIKERLIYPGHSGWKEFLRIAPALDILSPFFTGQADGESLGNSMLRLLEKTEQVEHRPLQRRLLALTAQAIEEAVSWIMVHPVANDPSSFIWIFTRLATQKKVPLAGSDGSGPTILHLSETIHLDFSRVILIGANEGMLPSTRAASTIIPFEIRRLFGLPMAEEEEQFQAWLFYRLLQRTQQADITYSIAGDALGKKEMSRYLIQLSYEMPELCPETNVQSINRNTVSPALISQRGFAADEQTREKLFAILERGISASAINTWNTCKQDFYFKYLLGLNEPPEMEESMKASTLGDIVHDVLHELYKPFINSFPDDPAFAGMATQIDSLTDHYIAEHFASVDSASGHNLIASGVIRSMIRRFIANERQAYKGKPSSERPVIIALEHPLKTPLRVEGIERPVMVRGVIDRLERTPQGYRVIDYKTGRVDQKDLKSTDSSSLTSKDKSKLLQLCLYMLLVHREIPEASAGVSGGIYSFVASRKGLLLAQPMGDTDLVTPQVITRIEESLAAVILEMINATEFSHDSAKYCTYCSR